MNKYLCHYLAPFKLLKPVTLIVVLFVFLNGCSNDPSFDEAVPETPVKALSDHGTIVAMGDSLTAGLGIDETEAYPAQLQKN